MKEFKDLGITPTVDHFIGEKIKISKVLNQRIVIEKYEINDSKYTNKVLKLQIKYKDENRVIFTGSRVLMNLIEQTSKEDFPFSTTIIKNGESLEFS